MFKAHAALWEEHGGASLQLTPVWLQSIFVQPSSEILCCQSSPSGPKCIRASKPPPPRRRMKRSPLTRALPPPPDMHSHPNYIQTTQRLLISPAPPVCTANIAALPCCCFLTHVPCLSHRHHVVTTLAAQGLILEGRSSQT